MKRGYLLSFFIISMAFVFIGKLFYLQVISQSNTGTNLKSSTIKKVFDYPERGYIYDRNGELLVANKQSYNLMIIPREVKPLDTLEFCKLLDIDKAYFLKRFDRAKHWSRRLPSVFLAHLSKEDYAYLQEKMHKYKGFFIERKLLRNYPQNSAANVLGYVNEVNDEIARRNPYYQAGELIGTTGVEKQYENFLRGKKGVKYLQRDHFNKIIGSYKGGVFDTIPVDGKDLTLTLDNELQLYGEALMAGKRGGIVAIEPGSGEILSLITMPSYNPNLMVGRERSKNSVIFFSDSINKPMYDRSLLAQYAPGSPFKIVQGLVGLQEEIITPTTSFRCFHGYKYGARNSEFMGCHCGIYNKPIQLRQGLAKSCNSYFSNVYRKIIEKYPTASEGMNAWSKHMRSFGLGQYLGYDLPQGQKGLIPDAALYNRWYPDGRWRATYTISNAIGQGQILTTPIQLANMTAAIANRGSFYTPHILKETSDATPIDSMYTSLKHTSINPKYFPPIIEGMHDVFKTGTAKHVRLKDIEICGKTGTAENFRRINGEKIQFEDHSIFVAFAPKHDPKIAIVVYIENGGFGSMIAAPITSLMIEKYLTRKTTNKYWEQRMLHTNLEEEYQKQLILSNSESTEE
ncbi:penicillin-binding protein 2 [Flavicella sp.]|uniref:penicillin-binding protein 2 n=1 Tax=Flavicella sp. TaxID=2957742 RepID=UPI002621EE51|nr:penicillin-binding protein 2 [Flavicella sp.]MDG1803574.1 penicillin-binding protein 2 [Flavicella sp.]